MQNESGRIPYKYRSLAGLATATLCISLIFLLSTCSREDPPETRISKKIVVPIKEPRRAPPVRSTAEAQEPSPAESAPPEEKPSTPVSNPKPENEEEVQSEARREEGIYRVQKGDTLLRIAGLQEVYGDPLKWPSLFRHNMDKLKDIGEKADIQHMVLPEGLELEYSTPFTASKRLGELDRHSYAINVLSSQRQREIVPPALTLIKNGYHVYIVKAEVKGEEWMRLRVGFFKDHSGAKVESKRIMSLLNSVNTWIVKVRDEELEEFGGY